MAPEGYGGDVLSHLSTLAGIEPLLAINKSPDYRQALESVWNEVTRHRALLPVRERTYGIAHPVVCARRFRGRCLECPETGGMTIRRSLAVRSAGSIAGWGNADAMGAAVDCDRG
jgi:hypothetical protein